MILQNSPMMEECLTTLKCTDFRFPPQQLPVRPRNFHLNWRYHKTSKSFLAPPTPGEPNNSPIERPIVKYTVLQPEPLFTQCSHQRHSSLQEKVSRTLDLIYPQHDAPLQRNKKKCKTPSINRQPLPSSTVQVRHLYLRFPNPENIPKKKVILKTDHQPTNQALNNYYSLLRSRVPHNPFTHSIHPNDPNHPSSSLRIGRGFSVSKGNYHSDRAVLSRKLIRQLKSSVQKEKTSPMKWLND